MEKEWLAGGRAVEGEVCVLGEGGGEVRGCPNVSGAQLHVNAGDSRRVALTA